VKFCEDRVGLFGFCDINIWIEDGSREGEGYHKLSYSKVCFLGNKFPWLGKIL
jgi:hypothetical protein